MAIVRCAYPANVIPNPLVYYIQLVNTNSSLIPKPLVYIQLAIQTLVWFPNHWFIIYSLQYKL